MQPICPRSQLKLARRNRFDRPAAVTRNLQLPRRRLPASEECHMPVVCIEASPVMRWFTDSGIAVPVVTTDQMREIDRIAIDETGPNLFQMMENAGRNIALQVMEILGVRRNTAKAIVLAGGGGNGGGGICAARYLANRDLV